MSNFLPAVLVGGPPHVGKSVLFYQLTQALRDRGIRHYAIRVSPDGEGNWFQEGEPESVSKISVNSSREWPTTFVERIRHDLEHRIVPLLVDIGGRPGPSQEILLSSCTHSILLLREDRPDNTHHWQDLITKNNLQLIAQLISRRIGGSSITTYSPILQGTISGLERHALDTYLGESFDALVQLVADLFTSYDLEELERSFFSTAPSELVLDLNAELHAFTHNRRWEPAMLPKLLERIPEQASLSIFGVGPNWLYAALAAHNHLAPFYLFDPRLPFQWVQPAQIYLGWEPSLDVQHFSHEYPEMTVLTINIPMKHLNYFQQDPLVFPPVSCEKGLIIDGPIPFWLLTALVRMYKNNGIPWIALRYVQIDGAVVAYSDDGRYHPGDIIPLPRS